MKIDDKEVTEFFLSEVDGHLATLSIDDREILLESLKNGNVFAMRNKEETMLMFALYRINKITYADFSNATQDYLNNKALLEKDISNFELLKNVEIYDRF